MSSKVSKIIQYLFFLLIGSILCWIFLKNISISDIVSDLKGRNYYWFYLVLLVSLIVYLIRAYRWKMLIESNEQKVKFMDVLSALSIGYFVNLAVPRLGEITRCLSLKKNYKTDFTELLGTVIIERAVDILSLLLFLLLTLALQFDHIIQFVKENVFIPLSDAFYQKVIHGKTIYLIILFIFLSILVWAFIYFRKKIKNKMPKLLLDFITGLKHGLISISKLKQKRLFVLLTILIWFGYYLMTYFWFFVFEEQTFLSWGVCLSIVAIGTIGRSVPIQGGGMGAYHFLVTGIVILYGGSDSFGRSLALLIHGGQTFFTFLMGIAGLLIFYINFWKSKRN